MEGILGGKQFSSFFLVLTVLVESACIREEVLDDIQSEYSQSQLVVHALLSPGDSVLVNVGRTTPLSDSVETSKVMDAVVMLSDEEGHVALLPPIQEDYHVSIYGINQQGFSIKAGSTYTLSVSHPELPSINASCTVPTTAIPLKEVAYTGKSSVPNDDRLLYDVQVSWYSSDLYLHRVYFVSQYQEKKLTNGEVLEEGKFYRSHDPFHGIEQTDSLFVYQDGFFSGGIHYSSLDTLPSGVISIGGSTPVSITHRLTTYLITPDEHMARYQESLDVFARNRDALSSDSFIELYRGIIPEYSNVEGGLGVFGAYLRSEPVYLTLE